MSKNILLDKSEVVSKYIIPDTFWFFPPNYQKFATNSADSVSLADIVDSNDSCASETTKGSIYKKIMELIPGMNMP